ncbi:hypothetical protein [Neorhizobium sp. LjRoot104]|uniref:hypothetical protein n=1 Tax=Neorhizobium sp. LjRoot104 TaxID=3342254 RepID=UPI003ECFEB2E
MNVSLMRRDNDAELKNIMVNEVLNGRLLQSSRTRQKGADVEMPHCHVRNGKCTIWCGQSGGQDMRTTITADEKLLAEAKEFSWIEIPRT